MTIKTCECGSNYDAEKYDQCYNCSMEANGSDKCVCGKCKKTEYALCYECSMKKKNYVKCKCGKGWHDPSYGQCYNCSQEGAQ